VSNKKIISDELLLRAWKIYLDQSFPTPQAFRKAIQFVVDEICYDVTTTELSLPATNIILDDKKTRKKRP
jgi:hypothetical protein